MSRVIFPMTLDELISEAIKAKAKFGGNKYVLLSTDEEGNGFHECYFTFSSGVDSMMGLMDIPEDLELEQCVTLG